MKTETIMKAGCESIVFKEVIEVTEKISFKIFKDGLARFSDA